MLVRRCGCRPNFEDSVAGGDGDEVEVEDFFGSSIGLIRSGA